MSRPTTLPVPRAVDRALARLDRRLRLAEVLRGAGVVAAAAAGLLAAMMAGDWAADWPLAARWGLGVAWWLAVAALAWRKAIRPLFRRRGAFGLAALAERADPRLGGSLAGAVDLLRPAPGRDAHGSPGLIAALAGQAADRAGRFDPRRAVGLGGAGRWLAAGGLAVALVAALCLARPDPWGVLARRTLAPWSGGDRVLLRVEPGDAVVRRGVGPKIVATARARFGRPPGADSARVEWADDRGDHATRMAPEGAEGPDGRGYAATLPGLEKSASYRVVVGSTRSPAYRVEVAEPPRVASLEARVEPPAYTGLPAATAADPRRIDAVAGSRVTLRVAADRPVASIRVAWPGPDPNAPEVHRSTLARDAREASFALTAGAGGPFEIAPIGDRRGMDGDPDGGRLRVRPDLPPTLAVDGPPAQAEAGPADVLRVRVAARDDFGVAGAELHHEVRRDGAVSTIGQSTLPVSGRDARGVGMLALGPLGLRPGDAVAWRVRVIDNRPGALGGPNEAWSAWSAVQVVAQAEPMQAKGDRLRKEAIADRLEGIKQAAQAIRREVEPIRQAAEQARGNPAAWDAADQADLVAREQEAAKLGDRIRDLALDLEDDPDFAPLAGPARQLAEVEAEAARAQLADAGQAPGPAARADKLRAAPARLDAARDKVDGLRRRLDALAKLADDRRKLGDLAAREDGLAARAAEPGSDAARLREDQEQVRRQLDDLLTRAPALRAGLLQAQAGEAAQLAEQARQLADRQRAEARRGAEADPADARLVALAEAQRAIEEDARRLAAEVDEPLAENARPRLDAEAVRRPAEPLARGDVDGGRKAIDEAESALRRLARDLGDLPADPRALARRLARRQEAVANEVAAATAEARRKPGDPDPAARAELAARLAPLAERQEAIARLAAAIPADGPKADAAREARDAAAKAVANLRDPRPREAELVQSAAKRALQRLADILDDPNRRRDESRQRVEEARRRQEDIARDLERQLADSAPRADRPADRAARELADRLEPLARRQEEAAKLLAALDVEPAARPRRDLAAARARDLSEAIRRAREVAPAKPSPPEPRPPAAWHVVGPYPKSAVPPIPVGVNWPVGLDVPVPGPDGQTLPWKPAPMAGDDGRVDLARIFGYHDDRSAFALATISSPTKRRATLAIGSDDTVVVWLNGVRVFERYDTRPYAAGQDRVEVEFVEGANRLLVRVGNVSGEWQFSVNATPPPPDGFDPARALAARSALGRAGVDASAAADRLVQEARGQQAADELARELAAEQRALADRPEPASTAPDRARIAAALRNLPAPDAPAEKAEALRRAEALARDPAPTADAIRSAADATGALALRLSGPAAAEPKPAPPDDPDLPLRPDHRARAEELARRQRHVLEGLQALGAERAGPQEAIREDTLALGRSLKDLQDRAREARAQSEHHARAAAELAADQAPRAMTQAAEQMAQGRADAARDARRQAADLAERAARHSEDLAAGLRAEAASAARPNPGDPGPPPPSGLAEATAALREAAAGLDPAQPGPPAAPAMRRAADAMRTASQPPGPSPGPTGTGPGMAAGPSGDTNPQSGPAGSAAPDTSMLPDLARGQPGRAWGELPPHLRAEILQQAQGRPRPEYARIIELYFREIAAESPRDKPR
ncbi:hypothetical protein TA3x_002098 [Tundrisphaera sp. TA3]|uniref:hypothetical protein n=1 Tax=Tundrisphaera sp. TA3 TaxID=3435775 RepID=UPI003EB7B495